MKLKELVWSILNISVESRNSDIELYKQVCQEQFKKKKNIIIEDFEIFLQVLWQMPRESAVVRRRAHFQKNWLYLPTEATAIKRRHKEIKCRDMYWKAVWLMKWLWK